MQFSNLKEVIYATKERKNLFIVVLPETVPHPDEEAGPELDGSGVVVAALARCEKVGEAKHATAMDEAEEDQRRATHRDVDVKCGVELLHRLVRCRRRRHGASSVDPPPSTRGVPRAKKRDHFLPLLCLGQFLCATKEWQQWHQLRTRFVFRNEIRKFLLVSQILDPIHIWATRAFCTAAIRVSCLLASSHWRNGCWRSSGIVGRWRGSNFRHSFIVSSNGGLPMGG